LPGPELPGFLPARLPARRRAARRIGLGTVHDANPGTRRRRARLLRAGIRPAAEGDLAGPGADAAVPGLAALQRRDPAATGAAAEDFAEHRGPGPPARSRPRPVDHRQAVPRALDARADRLRGLPRADAPGGGALAAADSGAA